MYSVAELQNIIEEEIKVRSQELKERHPADLFIPVDYSLGMGGKRLRPVLLLLSNHLFNENISNAVPAALAIEVFHNFTLLHDDIMDKANVRRNQATVHKKFSENGAILSGDVMAFLSYKYLLECRSEKLQEVLSLFTQTAIEVCEGQQFDMDFENRLDVKQGEYLEMIRLKTAVLLACALKSGALLANAGEPIAEQLYEYGINLGLAFQLQDDLLDTFGNQEAFGKRIGGDILANKKTYLLIQALQNAPENLKQELLAWINKTEYEETEKIDAVKSIYIQLGIKELTQQKIDYYFKRNTEIYQKISIEENNKKLILSVTSTMLNRVK